MNYSFFDFLTLVGSLGLFLYGMKIMSEGLQKVAGNKLRSLLATMTKNRFAGVLTGLFITALIQSSSATTVMVVSFVNAGLLTLLQSITVIRVPISEPPLLPGSFLFSGLKSVLQHFPFLLLPYLFHLFFQQKVNANP